MASIPWAKKARTAAKTQTPAVYDPAAAAAPHDPAAFLDMIQSMAAAFPQVTEEAPAWMAARTEVTKWNPKWSVDLMEYPRQALRFGMWVTAHAVRFGLFLLVMAAAVILIVVQVTS
jgi:hypothetical protein